MQRGDCGSGPAHGPAEVGNLSGVGVVLVAECVEGLGDDFVGGGGCAGCGEVGELLRVELVGEIIETDDGRAFESGWGVAVLFGEG